jgi:predicted  nucleic acid-binding Zn-ribbon protein
MSRKLIAIVALLLAVLLPVRGFAAHMLAGCAMNGGNSPAHQTHHAKDASDQATPPCHEMTASTATAADESAADDGSATADSNAMDDACSARCSACAASCSAPALAPSLLSLNLEAPESSMPIASDSAFVNAQLARADKPPVL